MLFVILIIFGLVWWFKRTRKLRASFPGPVTIPLLGNLLQLYQLVHLGKRQIVMNVLNTISKYKEEYSGDFSVYLGPIPIIFLSDPDCVMALLKSANHNKPVFNFFDYVFCGAVGGNGERWKTSRRLLTPSFNPMRMDRYAEIFNEELKTLMDQLSLKVGKGVFDIKDEMKATVLHITVRVVCGIKNVHDIETESLNDIRRIEERFLERVLSPWMFPDFIYFRTQGGYETKIIASSYFDLAKWGIERRNFEKNTSVEDCDSVKDDDSMPYLDRLLKHAKETSLPKAEVHRILLDSVGAGFDTVISTASFIFVMLGIHQEVQHKAYQEIKSVLGDSKKPITIKELEDMTYLEMIFQEAIRLTGPYAEIREINKDIKIGENVLPGGSFALYSMYHLHRDPKFWANANDFYPEHHLPESVAKRPKNSYIPFSAGARRCPGDKYASYLVKAIISTIIRKYKIISHLTMREVEEQYHPVLMVEIRDGYPIEIIERR